MEQNKTTICLSDEIKENFNEWLKSWDFKINSADNRDNLQKAIEKAESLETHKELQKINNLAFSLMYYIENLNELKNIRTKENFKLRAEISKIKNERF